MRVPGLGCRPNATFSGNVPAGVMLLPSDALPTPSEPTWQPIGPSARRQPPSADRDHVDNEPVVALDEPVLTVINCRHALGAGLDSAAAGAAATTPRPANTVVAPRPSRTVRRVTTGPDVGAARTSASSSHGCPSGPTAGESGSRASSSGPYGRPSGSTRMASSITLHTVRHRQRLTAPALRGSSGETRTKSASSVTPVP